MSITDRLTQIWTRFRARLAGMGTAGAGSDGKLSGAQQDDLVTLLNKGRPGQRWLAAEALGEVDPGRGGVTALAEALTSADPILRAEAGAALAHIGGRTARSALLQAAAAGDPAAQAVAADALGKMSTDEATASALQALLDSSEAVVRQSAAEALARTGWPPQRKPAETRPDPGTRLLDLLTGDPEPMVRRAAALALGKLGDPATKEALTARQDDSREDWLVRAAAALAVSRLGEDNAAEDSVVSNTSMQAESETSDSIG